MVLESPFSGEVNKCIGMYTPNECASTESKTNRWLKWMDCGDIIWETCFKNPQKFTFHPYGNQHPHDLTLITKWKSDEFHCNHRRMYCPGKFIDSDERSKYALTWKTWNNETSDDSPNYQAWYIWYNSHGSYCCDY